MRTFKLQSQAKLWSGMPVLIVVLLLGPATVSAQEADPDDVASIEAIIHAVYDVISGDAGVVRDWRRWYSLFAPQVMLSAVVENEGFYRRVLMTPDSYAANSGPQLEAAGFHETEIHRLTEQFGQIAHVFSTYESRRSASDAEPFARGINSLQLFNDGSRWWVVSIYWQAESEAQPIPRPYLGLQ